MRIARDEALGLIPKPADIDRAKEIIARRFAENADRAAGIIQSRPESLPAKAIADSACAALFHKDCEVWELMIRRAVHEAVLDAFSLGLGWGKSNADQVDAMFLDAKAKQDEIVRVSRGRVPPYSWKTVKEFFATCDNLFDSYSREFGWEFVGVTESRSEGNSRCGHLTELSWQVSTSMPSPLRQPARWLA